MFSIICLIVATSGLSFIVGFIWKSRQLEKEKDAVVRAELKMLDTQDVNSRLLEENNTLKNLLEQIKRERNFI